MEETWDRKNIIEFFQGLDAMPVDKRQFEWRGYVYRLNREMCRYEKGVQDQAQDGDTGLDSLELKVMFLVS